MIQQKIDETNKSFFSQRNLHLALLKNYPQVIPTLADWLYDTWHPYDTSLTREKLIHSFEARLNSDQIPITFVILENNKPIGLVSLKRQTSPELSDFSKDSLWMGGLQVIEEKQNQGLGQELLRFAANMARLQGLEKLHFYTSDPSKVAWYLKRGAQILEKRPFRNHTITIMYLPLRNN